VGLKLDVTSSHPSRLPATPPLETLVCLIKAAVVTCIYIQQKLVTSTIVHVYDCSRLRLHILRFARMVVGFTASFVTSWAWAPV
jgi:hypothetical protein